MNWHFDNSYARDLPGTYVAQTPSRAPAPQLLKLNVALAAELGLDPAALRLEAAEVFSGNQLPEGAEPIAQAYAGHQFGGFSPQLGDGRALLLGEVIDIHGQRRDIALKGSGRTPFSRRGDGLAAIGPVLREYLMGEAMAALGVPTSRALAAVATGARVQRERGLPGAVLTRVAASHLRIGSFEFFSARGDRDMVRKLADYAIARHYPDLPQDQGHYLAFFDAVTKAQAWLIAQWMGLGFIHGVMNTDNMTISGETIDYGPCAFMEGTSPGAVFSSIDHQGRYAYGNQPLILGWNLARLAETLLPLFDADETRSVDLANDRLGGIAGIYRAEWTAVMRGKLGLEGAQDGDTDLAEGFVAALNGTDWTLGFRRLARAQTPEALRGLFKDMAALEAWWPRWQARRAPDATARMLGVNPAYIPRNQRVEEALAAAETGDLAPFEALLVVLQDPFSERPGLEAYALPAPESFAGTFRTFCGT